MKGSLYGIAAWFGTNKDGKGDKSGEAPIECCTWFSATFLNVLLRSCF